MALICDTGALLAALDRADPAHSACAGLIDDTREELLVPGLVLVELDYWCHKLRLPIGWSTFLEDVERGVWRLVWPALDDLRRARELEQQYADLGLGVVDATIIALAERLNEPKVATLDRRHFATVRPNHVVALQLLPEN